MAYEADDQVPSAGTAPALGTPAWCDAHGHPRAPCDYGCEPPVVSWNCPTLRECDNDFCRCHYGAFL
jgi:hypothetical protein